MGLQEGRRVYTTRLLKGGALLSDLRLLLLEWDGTPDAAERIVRDNVLSQASLIGPVGRPHVVYEMAGEIQHRTRTGVGGPLLFMEVRGLVGDAFEPNPPANQPQHLSIHLRRPGQLALSTMTNPAMSVLYSLREYVQSWRMYSAFGIDQRKIREPALIEEAPVLQEDAGNLSSVLFWMTTEDPSAFQALQSALRSVVPGFRGLTVKARGGPGRVMALWQEGGIDEQLTLADLSDGTLRLICWATLCLMPNVPPLLCIDEPDQGVHPRTLPVLAGLFEKASARTQLLLATHASYFLTQFDVSRLAVMKKVDGQAVFLKPADSKALQANLEDFGIEELEAMHRSDELEALS